MYVFPDPHRVLQTNRCFLDCTSAFLCLEDMIVFFLQGFCPDTLKLIKLLKRWLIFLLFCYQPALIKTILMGGLHVFTVTETVLSIRAVSVTLSMYRRFFCKERPLVASQRITILTTNTYMKGLMSLLLLISLKQNFFFIFTC